MPGDAAALCRRLSLISFPGGSTPINQPFPTSRGSNNEKRQYRPFSTSTFASVLLPPGSRDSKNSSQRLEYLAIPKKFSAKVAPSLASNGSMNSEVIILSQPQKILTYRIHIPRGDQKSTVSSEPVFSKSKRKLLFAREARAKSAPPICSWNRYLQNSTISGSHTCKYDTVTNKCQNYPCNIPMAYNSLGFDIDHNRANRFKTANQLSTRARQRLIKHLENESVRRPLRSSVEQTANREKALKTFIWQMKTRTESGRPKDWATNYGAPLSKRKVFSGTKSSHI